MVMAKFLCHATVIVNYVPRKKNPCRKKKIKGRKYLRERREEREQLVRQIADEERIPPE